MYDKQLRIADTAVGKLHKDWLENVFINTPYVYMDNSINQIKAILWLRN